jgi:predicted negative regulator of RcsB-dependent stress response
MFIRQIVQIQFVFAGMIILGYFQIFFCTLQLFGIESSFTPIFPVSGTFDNISELCIYLTFILPAACIMGYASDDSKKSGILIRIVCLLFVVLWLLIVCMAGSRTSMLSGALFFIFFVFVKTNTWKYFKQTRGFIRKYIVLSFIIVSFIAGSTLLLSYLRQDSASGRLLIWKIASYGIRENPITGHGFNAFQAKYGTFQAQYFQQHPDNENEKILADNMSIAMNDYVELVFNLGFIGLILYGTFWLFLICRYNYNEIQRNQVVLAAVSVLCVFLVCNCFYFVDKMLSVKIILFLFAAYLSSTNSQIIQFNLHKAVLVVTIIAICFVGYRNIQGIEYSTKWKEAALYERYGYSDSAEIKCNEVYSALKDNAMFLFLYSKVLYANQSYSKCIEYMEKVRSRMAFSGVYSLLGDAYSQSGNWESAEKNYQYAARIVPNRFRPLFKLFRLYIQTKQTDKAIKMAHIIVNKRIKVDSGEIQNMIKECNDFIDRLKI